jgi:hypothetical protein
MGIIILIYVYVLCMNLLINSGSHTTVSTSTSVYKVKFPLLISENHEMKLRGVEVSINFTLLCNYGCYYT